MNEGRSNQPGRSDFDPAALFRQLPPVEVTDECVASMQQRVRLLVEHEDARLEAAARRHQRRRKVWYLVAAAVVLLVLPLAVFRLAPPRLVNAQARSPGLIQFERLVDALPLIEELGSSSARVAYQITAPPIDVVVLVSEPPSVVRGTRVP